MTQQCSIFECKTPLSFIKSSAIAQTVQERVIMPLYSQCHAASSALWQPWRCISAVPVPVVGPGLCRGCVKWLQCDFSLGGGLQVEGGGSEEAGQGVQGVTTQGGCSGMAGMGTVSAGVLEDGISPGAGGCCGGFAEHQFCSQRGMSTTEPRSHFWEGFWDQARAGKQCLGWAPPAAPAPTRDTGQLQSNHPTASPTALHPQFWGGHGCSPRAPCPAGSSPHVPHKIQVRAELVFREPLGDSPSARFADSISLSVEESERGRTAFVVAGC